ncbi:hypothetical protein ACTMS0_28250 [Micromonospora sp. H33]
MFRRTTNCPDVSAPAFEPDAYDRPDYRQRVGRYDEESYRRG